MTSSGGAGTHYGVLYQALGTLDTTLGITSRGDAADPEAITLLVEPRGGGGDLVANSGNRRTFFQFKARGDHRTWSLNEILDDALSDLYRARARAVPQEPDQDCEYLLVTEGREGQIGVARLFFRELCRDSVPPDPLSALDDVKEFQFFPSAKQMSRRAFFARVTRRLTHRNPTTDDYRRVWSLLSRFDICQRVFEDVQRSVERRLLGYVDAPEDVAGKAREIYGILLEFAASGDRTFTPKSLLRLAGLPERSLAEIRSSRASARDRLKTKLKRLGIDSDLLVPRSSTFKNQRIFCLAGESGSGKTTLAAQVALERSETEVVVFVSNRQGVKGALEEAADEVWKRVLGHGRSLDWDSLAVHATRLGVADGEPWLTLVLDITASAGELESLLRLEWAEWNVNFLFTADNSAGERIRNDPALSRQCGWQLLADFSVEERYDLLRRRGRSIAEIPGDVFALLARPILADLYCRIAKDPKWHPENEYQLFDEFWSYAESDGQGDRHRENLSVLLQLGEFLVDDSHPYPWPIDVLHRVPIDDRVLQRLIERNWIREIDGNFEFAHDRFANWAVARVIAERVRRGSWLAGDVGPFLAAIYARARTGQRSAYGYVPMDTLWLLARRDENRTIIADTLREFYHRDWDGVATIGAAIVPALYDYIRACEPDSLNRIRAIETVRRIANSEQIPEGVVAEWLMDASRDIHRAGLAIARTQPQTGLIELLWRLERAADALPDKHAQSYWKYDSTLRATLTAVRASPTWFRDATRDARSPGDLSTIAWMLSMIGDDRGRALWNELKPKYLELFAAKGVRGVIQCIDRYGDRSEINRLMLWIHSGDNFVPAEALAALAAMDAPCAFAILEQDPLNRVESLAAFWLPPLLLSDGRRTRRTILAGFVGNQLSAAWLHWELRGENQADPPLVRAIAKRIVALATEILRKPRPDKPPVEIEHLLATLGGVNSIRGLDALRHDTPDLGPVLLRLAEWYTPHDGNTLERWFVRHIQHVLLRLGGEALGHFVSLQLTKPGDWPTADIRSAVTSPSEAAVSLLHQIAMTAPASDADRIRSMDAVLTIAALGDRKAVLDLIEKSDYLWVKDELSLLLEWSAPAGDDQLYRLLNDIPIEPRRRIRRYHLLSLTARPDAVDVLVDEFLIEPDEEVKTAALYAIRALADSSCAVEKVLQIGFDQEREGLAMVLYAIGTGPALDELERRLLSLDGSTISEDLVWIAALLVNHRQRHALARVVWEFIQEPRRRLTLDTTPLYKAIGSLNSVEAIEALHAAAFAEGEERLGGILGLAQVRPRAAFDAAAAALASEEPDRGDYAEVLVAIDAQSAITVLCERLIAERFVRPRSRICRALRAIQANGTLRRKVTEMLISANAVERASGCQIAGWFNAFESAKLKTIAVRDSDVMVRAFALDAVRMHQQHRRISGLLSELRQASSGRAWALLQMVLDSGSALLLTKGNDTLCLYTALEGKVPAMRLYAQSRLSDYFKSESREKHDAFENSYR